jgi:hypothetical protein
VIDDSSWTIAQGEERGIVPHALVGRTMDTVAWDSTKVAAKG